MEQFEVIGSSPEMIVKQQGKQRFYLSDRRDKTKRKDDRGRRGIEKGTIVG